MYGKKLGRSSNQRAGLFKSLVQSLFTYGTITTTQTKASAIKGMIDKIITAAKNEQVLSNRNKNSQKLLQSFFADKLLQERLIKEIAPKMQNRISGYTSMIKVGVQEGDRTTLVKMSLIGLEDLKPLEKPKAEERKSKAPLQAKEVKKKKVIVSKAKVTKRRTSK